MVFDDEDENETKCENLYINLCRKKRSISDELYEDYKSLIKSNEFGINYFDEEE